MTIQSVTYIGPTLIRLNLSFSARLDPEFLLSTNYAITPHTGSEITGEAVNVLEVLPPSNDVYVDQFVYLRTTKHTEGASYDVTYRNLTDSAGRHVGLIGEWADAVPYVSRITKTVQVLKSIPAHFDVGETSLIRNLLTAISLSDDALGGSRNDSFSSAIEPPTRVGLHSLLRTESGLYLLTENGDHIAVE